MDNQILSQLWNDAQIDILAELGGSQLPTNDLVQVACNLWDLNRVGFERLSYSEQQELVNRASNYSFERAKLALQEQRLKERIEQEPVFLDFDLDSESVEIPWIFENFNAHNDLTVIVGDGNVGKTFFLLDLAFSAMMGETFANEFECSAPKKVLMIIGEGNQGIQRRLKGVCEKYGLDKLPDSLRVTLRMPDFGIGEGILQLQRDLGDFEPDIIIIDTLSVAMHGRDENSNANISKAFNLMKNLAKPFNASVIVTHHTAKYDGKTFRGASAIRDNADNVYRLVKQSNDTAVSISKQRDGKPFKTFGFNIQDNENGFPYVEFTAQSVREDGKVGATQKDKVLMVLGYGEATVDELLTSLEKELNAVNRRNLKKQVLTPLLEDGMITEVEENTFELNQ